MLRERDHGTIEHLMVLPPTPMEVALSKVLATMVRSMAQFALLEIMVIVPVIMLSDGMGAVESQPDIIQRLTLALPSRHFLAFAKAVAFRGAGIGSVWVELVLMAGLGAVFFAGSLALFRRSMNLST